MEHIEIFFDVIMHQAVKLSASDIHFDLSKQGSILFRRHKQNIESLEDDKITALYEYLRFKAQFDLSLGSQPQSGSFEYIVDEIDYALRFSCIETFSRKHAVLRILNMNSIGTLKQSIPQVKVYQEVLKEMKARNGIILFSGMTGSGKTTTMFNALKELSDKQIFTLENPIETHHSFCIQLELNTKQQFGFEEALNQLLRHDPDVIVLGEIRSEDDLKQCIRCGLSGHLVVSTIHSGSIENTIHRLLDLGVNDYDLMHALKYVVYQEMIVREKLTVQYKTANRKQIQSILNSKQIQEAKS